MPPPPPPFGRARKRAGNHLDPALGDAELIAARAALTQGRWTAVRELLATTGADWDLRGHRLTVLAGTPGAAAWGEEWRIAEPDSVDAAALIASATVVRALGDRRYYPEATAACHHAAVLAPEDPTPWLALLLLARRRGTEDEVVRLFDAVRVRHQDHHMAHHLMVARLAERHPEDGRDPLHEVYDFAAWSAEHASPDSPLAVLPVVAHAERYRVLAAAGSEPPDPAASGHWRSRRARQVLRTAFDWWLEWEQRLDRSRIRTDLNYLAHAKFCEGRPAEAAALFHRIGPHATRAPWAYPDRDPYDAFHAARSAALGTA
ncbi:MULTISPECIES: hypothetical protein [Streptomyces]|uniref:Uncharacterized protein n=3 Tax=Streptomyces TaxID=1883 RepID=A0A380NCA9_STRGR|nr:MULTISPECIES: hypothetical protein [Streptomyces]NEE51865.1 hypothetical protein [Streptomyces sp. SID8455]MDQ0296648.1 hypothetical protein [Streptomyces sp. DSM 41037]PJM82527.1 hypothetical protein CH313_18095 [Streptomyces sp. TSRI0384-2]QNE80467.1 hypothetical protein F0345_04505 [Streptomyces rutgersensis]RPK81526.1 hypothetical protein EES47_26860 [Streptomyces sp. ADI98-12]